jgi:hypothetical protein
MDDFFWDLFQQFQIGKIEKSADHAVAASARAQAEVSTVDARIDRLSLMCFAMWELVRERTGVTDIDLMKKMHEIDLRDGVADGKRGFAPVKCANCGKTISEKDEICIYCAQQNARKTKLIFP